MGWGMITICNSCGHRSETIRAGFTCGSDIMAKRPYGAEQCSGQMQPQAVNVGDVWEIFGERWEVLIRRDDDVAFIYSEARDLSQTVLNTWLQALGERIEP